MLARVKTALVANMPAKFNSAGELEPVMDTTKPATGTLVSAVAAAVGDLMCFDGDDAKIKLRDSCKKMTVFPGWTAPVPTTVPVPTQRVKKYNSFAEMNSDICKLDPKKYCRGGQEIDFRDVCANFASLPVEIQQGASLDYACKADWKTACTGQYKDMICAGDKINTNLCALDQSRCAPSATEPTVDPCRMGWFECVIRTDFKICDQWPQLCSGTPTMPAVPTSGTQKFQSFYEMQDYLCQKNKDKFCRGGKELVFQDVCKNIGEVEIEVMAGSSIASICQADIVNKICTDQSPTSALCPDGKIKSNFCSEKPGECTAGSSTYKKCTENWKSCLNEVGYNFCKDFPEYCNQQGSGVTIPPTSAFKNGQELIDKICSTDKAKFCGGGEKPRLDGVCVNWESLPNEVKTQSSFYQLCTTADWGKLCYDKDPASKKVCDNTVFRSSLCEMFPDRCKDKCVANIYDCLADATWHKFKEEFPTLVKQEVKPMEFKDGQAMIDYLCKADAAKFCGGGKMIEINAVCDKYQEIPEREAFEKGTSLMSICSNADRQAFCVTDAAKKDKVCPDGKIMSSSLCAMYPDKCKAGTQPDRCTDNVYDCLATNQDWDFFCRDYPELCFKKYKNGQEMLADICAFDKGRYCNANSNQVNFDIFCNGEEWGKLPESIKRSGMYQFCD